MSGSGFLLACLLLACLATAVGQQEAVLVPEFRWSQRKGALAIAIEIPRVSGTPSVTFSPDGTVTFAASSTKTGRSYALELDLFRPINSSNCTFTVKPTEVRLHVQKARWGRHWPRLLKGRGKLWNMKKDWDMFVEERREGVKWNDEADRPWEWWNSELGKDPEEDDEDEDDEEEDSI